MPLPFTDTERGLVGEPATDNAYLPFHAARKTGVLGDPAELATSIPHPPGVDIANGRIPNSKGAGVVEMRGGELLIFDHAAVGMEGDRLNVFPATKDAVDDEGRITQEGAVLMATPGGLLQIVGRAVDKIRHPWLADRLRAGRPSKSPMGRIAVFNTRLGETREFEIKDVDGGTGIVQAEPRVRYL
jgi:hypothetical protein